MALAKGIGDLDGRVLPPADERRSEVIGGQDARLPGLEDVDHVDRVHDRPRCDPLDLRGVACSPVELAEDAQSGASPAKSGGLASGPKMDATIRSGRLS